MNLRPSCVLLFGPNPFALIQKLPRLCKIACEDLFSSPSSDLMFQAPHLIRSGPCQVMWGLLALGVMNQGLKVLSCL